MGRKTRQRHAIREIFAQADRPLKPHEVLELAKKDIPGIGVATIYRNINRLVSEGWLVPVEIPGDSARYETAMRPHHHFFCCRACGKVFNIHGCLHDYHRLTPAGFELEAHELLLYGRCKSCIDSGVSAPADPSS
jgi:Fur family transcriptional regulator, ferric uptake regulator